MRDAVWAATAATMTAAVTIWASAPAAAVELPPSGTIDMSQQAEVRLRLGGPVDQAVTTVSSLGDFDGDGRADAAIGARLQDPLLRPDAGSAFVVFGGGLSGDVDLDELGTRGLRIDGAGPGDRAGFHVVPAGDVDGDKLADLIVGAPFADANGEDSGTAYIVLGRPGGGAIDLGQPSDRVISIVGAAAHDRLGWSAIGAGDQNGDGRDDVAIGAPGAGEFGSVYLLDSVGQAGNVRVGEPTASTLRITSPGPGRLGWSVGRSVDMTGDGVWELVLAAPALDREGQLSGIGSAYAVFGPLGTPPPDPSAPISDAPPPDRVLDLAQLGERGLAIRGIAEPAPHGDVHATYVAGLGDLDGDGRGDIGVAAHWADPPQRSGAGRMYVISGSPQAGELRLGPPDPRVRQIDGALAGDQTGHSFAPVGDFNADGLADFATVALTASPLGRESAGSVTVLFAPLPTGLDLANMGERGVRMANDTKFDWAGPKVAGAGDLTGDGTADVLVGGVIPAAAPAPATVAYVVSGVKPTIPPPPDPGQVEEQTIDRCKAVNNVELVIDDSGSMYESDSDRLRRTAAELMLAKPRNENRVVGAVEFGDSAQQLFAPQKPIRVGPQATLSKLLTTLDERIKADNGGTNYNAAFESLIEDNPAAGARVFLTDGAHNAGEYADPHRNGPPTYVIGLEIGKTGVDGKRLQRIAGDTKGLYFPRVTAAKLQSVFNVIDSRLNCDVELDAFVDTLTADEPEAEPNEVPIEPGAYSADIHVSWEEPADQVEITGFDLLDGAGKVVGHLGRKSLQRAVRYRRTRQVGRLQVLGSRGKTYASIRVRGLDGGKQAKRLRVRVAARKVRGRNARAHTQIMQSRRRS